jgi:hypothetical protein
MTDHLDRLAARDWEAPPEVDVDDDWKGERKIREAKRSHQNEGNFTLRRELSDRLGPANKRHEGGIRARFTNCKSCGKALDRRNKLGYCKEHRHLSGYGSKRRGRRDM